MSDKRVHNIVIPSKPLSNTALEHAVSALPIPHFWGAVMRDTLPPKAWHIERGILNHDKWKVRGTHWTCWFKGGPTKYYFDSFGMPPPDEILRNSIISDHCNDLTKEQFDALCCWRYRCKLDDFYEV